MARAKCQYDRQWIDTNIAHKEIVDGKKLYWCNEDCYKAWKEQTEKANGIKAEYDEIFAITKQIFGYEIASYSLLRKEINAWEKLTTRQNIISYLTENNKKLSDIMSKPFDHEFGRIKYFSVVVSSKLRDYKPKKQEVIIPAIKEEHCITKYKHKARKALLDFEEEYDE